MLCNHDDERCEVCTTCQVCMPHPVGHRDGEALRGGCRDADLRRRLEELDVLERGAASVLAMTQETGNADNERGSRELLEQIAGIVTACSAWIACDEQL